DAPAPAGGRPRCRWCQDFAADADTDDPLPYVEGSRYRSRTTRRAGRSRGKIDQRGRRSIELHMDSYDCPSIGNAAYARTIAGNLICDRSRTTTRRSCRNLKLLNSESNACATTLYRSVMDFRVERW